LKNKVARFYGPQCICYFYRPTIY